MSAATSRAIGLPDDVSAGDRVRSKLADVGEMLRPGIATDRLIDLLVDAVGVGVAGGQTEMAKKCSTVLGASEHPWDRAWLHGARIHALDFDDTHEPSLCHTGASLVPGLLALGMETRRSGAEVLAAFEFGLRVVDFLSPFGPRFNEMGLHSTGILGTIGAAAGCSWLLARSPDQTADAVEMAALMTGGLGVAFGTDSKPVQAGRAAEAGVRAAMLVQADVGAPAGALLGPRGLIALWLGPEAPQQALWAPQPGDPALAVAMKPYPSCFLTHSTIDAALAAREALAISASSQVRSVRITVHPLARTIADKTTIETEADSKFSVRYCVLAALADGLPVQSTFTEATRRRLSPDATDWASWVARCQLEVDANLPRLASRFSVETTDGRAFALEVAAPLGSAAHPLDRNAVLAKFHGNVAGILGTAEADGLLDELLGFATSPDISRLTALKATQDL